jgi:spermidine/putrescine transport system permease protein
MPHVSIFVRSVMLSLGTTVLTLLVGFPTAYFIATRQGNDARTLAAADHHPVLDQPAHPHVCHPGDHAQRRADQWLAAEVRADRTAHSDALHRRRDPDRHGLCLSAADGAAALCQHGKAGFPAGGSGYDLYATPFKVLRKIIIPLVKPGIIAGSILVFIPALGAYVTPSILGGGKNLMLGNLIELQFGQGRNWPLGSALSISLMLIVMVALLVYVRNAGSQGSRQHG